MRSWPSDVLFFQRRDFHIHTVLIADFGGSDGIRDSGILESAINTPLQTFDSIDLYPSPVEKIARLSFGLAMDHPFFDGNKRIAAAILYLGLSANRFSLKATDEEVIEEFLELASGGVRYQDFLSWVQSKI